MLDRLTSDDFSGLLQETFRVARPDGAATLTGVLVDVEELGKAAGDAGRRPFSIVFRVDHDAIWPQGIYRVSHERIGELDLFLVPIGQSDDCTRYEAVFS